MQIVRAPRPTSNYTLIRNDVLRDIRLSFTARGVLTYILSHSNNWRTDIDTLAAASGTHIATINGEETARRNTGREAITAAMKELRVAGYINQERFRAANGTYGWTVTVYDTPQGAEAPVEPVKKSDPIKATAARLVADIWEPAVKGQTSQPAVAVVGIVANALNNGINETKVRTALSTLAHSKRTVTTASFDEAINGRKVKGQIEADKPQNFCAGALDENGETPF